MEGGVDIDEDDGPRRGNRDDSRETETATMQIVAIEGAVGVTTVADVIAVGVAVAAVARRGTARRYSPSRRC